MKHVRAVVWLRCIAALLIINSHMLFLYPPGFQFLSFGGLFGNCLFMLISGYCLADVRGSFVSWTARRLIRVYVPYLIVTVLSVFLSVGEELSPGELLLPVGRYHFIASIVTLYPVWYLLCRVSRKYGIPFRAMLPVAAVSLTLAFFLMDYRSYGLYIHYNLFELLCFLTLMLLGASMREGLFPRKPFLLAGVTVASFSAYAIVSLCLAVPVKNLLLWYLAGLLVYSLSGFFLSIEEKLPEPLLIRIVSSITLEMYLLQFQIILWTQSMVFPFSFVVCVLSVLVSAWLLHELSSRISAPLVRRLR